MIPPGALTADGFDDCVIGYEKGRVIYSYEACVEALMKDQGWSYDLSLIHI